MNQDLLPRPDDEIEARKAIELHPHRAQAYYHLGLLLAELPARASEAEAACRQAIELEPENARYVYRLALWLHEHSQHFAEAEILYRRAIALTPNDPFVYGGLVSLLVQQLRQAEANVFAADMRTLLIASENWFGLATLDSILGNVNASLNSLRKAAGRPNFNHKWARSDPDLAAIRNDPQFDVIVGSV